MKKAKTVLAKPGTDTELLETLLNILLSNEGLARTRLELQNTNTKSKSDQLENESKENGAADSETSVFDLKCLGKWLKALTVMDKFDLNIRFVTKTTIQSVVRILEELNLNSLQSTLDLYKSVQ